MRRLLLSSSLLALLTAGAISAQDGSKIEVLAQGPLGNVCLDGKPEGSCPVIEETMGWFVNVRSDDADVIAYLVTLSYTDKDGNDKQRIETSPVLRDTTDTVLVPLRVGPFRAGGNVFKRVEIKALKASGSTSTDTPPGQE